MFACLLSSFLLGVLCFCFCVLFLEHVLCWLLGFGGLFLLGFRLVFLWMFYGFYEFSKFYICSVDSLDFLSYFWVFYWFNVCLKLS